MKRFNMLLAILLPLALTVPAGAQGCGGMGIGHMEMGPGCCGMMGMGGMSGMCGGMGMGPCLMMPGTPMPIMMMLGSLDLTDAQWEEIDGIMADAEEQIADAAEEAGLADPQAAFVEMFTHATLTVSALEDFADRAAALGEEIRGIQDEALVRIHDVLTSDQLAELAAMATPGSNADSTRCGRGTGRMGGMGRMEGTGRTGGCCGRGTR